MRCDNSTGIGSFIFTITGNMRVFLIILVFFFCRDRNAISKKKKKVVEIFI